MRDHNRLAQQVDLVELAERTKNFTGAEIEGLVRAAQATAMNRLIKVTMVARTVLLLGCSAARVLCC